MQGPLRPEAEEAMTLPEASQSPGGHKGSPGSSEVTGPSTCPVSRTLRLPAPSSQAVDPSSRKWYLPHMKNPKILLVVLAALALSSCRPDVPGPQVRYCNLVGHCEVAQ